MQHFVYLEFTDPKLREFLWDLRTSLQGARSHAPIHITIRGPYTEAPALAYLQELQDRLNGCGVLIGGVGMFELREGYSVHLKAQSPVFRELWWKPDYPADEFGINPHITMFESTSLVAAKAVTTFLRTERIEIFTFALRLSAPQPKQMALFEVDLDADLRRKRSAFERWRVKPGILQRAERVRSNLRQ